jgi:hypothetical protein
MDIILGAILGLVLWSWLDAGAWCYRNLRLKAPEQSRWWHLLCAIIVPPLTLLDMLLQRRPRL